MASTANLENVYAVTFKKETTFSSAPSGTYTALRLANKPDFKPEIEKLATENPKYKLTNLRSDNGGKGGTISLELFLFGSGTAAGQGTNVTDPEFIELLIGSAWKRLKTGSYDGGEVQSATSTTITLDTGEGADFEAGSPVYTADGGLRAVTSVATDTLTLNTANAAVPTASDIAYNGLAIMPAREAADMTTSDTFTFKLYTKDYILQCVGCAVNNFIITGEAGQKLKVKLDINVNSFSYETAGTPETISSSPNEIAVLASPVIIGDNEIASAGFEFNANMTLAAMAAMGKTEGREGWIVTGMTPVLKINGWYDDTEDHHAGWMNETDKEVLIQIGNTAGNIIGMFIPVAELIATDVMRDGRRGLDLEYRALEATSFSGDVHLYFV